jgi:class 3 adenylate cyclase
MGLKTPLSATGRAAALSATLVPLAGLVVLLAAPDLDVRWEHHPAHFWLVIAVGATAAGLAYATGDAARRRGDARVQLVSLAFFVSTAFLFLHALATPGVLLDRSNTGFMIATPVGLMIAGVLFAASAVEMTGRTAPIVVRRASAIRAVLVVLVVAWGAASVADLPPLSGAPLERGSPVLIVVGVVSVACFAMAAVAYARLYRRRPSNLLVAVIAGAVLLAEAMTAVALSRNWHTSWWEWHVLLLVAFGVVAWTARSQWRQERFTPLYLEETAAGRREVSVIFADLQGFTSFSETRDPKAVQDMLNALLEVAVPAVVREHEGQIEQISGDAIMATFNTRGDQLDHAVRAARAALGMRDAAASVARQHPDWPKLRIGVNTGDVLVGVVGTEGARTYTILGDPVNVAARLEQHALPGAVVVGARTASLIPGARLEALGPLKLKGKDETVQAFVLTALDDTAS